MANYYEETNISSKRFVNVLSRYNGSKVIYYTDRRLITFPIYRRRPIASKKEDRFMVITKGVEYRPDLVSQDAYGTPDLWWKIMQANDLHDIYEFKAGVNIVVPSSVF